MFSREIQKFKQWPELFVELLHILFKISVVTFIDEDGSGAIINLFVPDILRNEILYIMRVAGEKNSRSEYDLGNVLHDQQYIMMMKKQNRYYPIFIVDSDLYFKTMDVDKRIYSHEDKIVQLLYNMIKYDSQINDINIGKNIDLSFMKAFVAKYTEYKIKSKFINRQNMCYAVLLTNVGADVYMPIEYSVYISDNIELAFDAFDRKVYKLSLSALEKCLNNINEFIQAKYTIGASIHSYNALISDKYLKLDPPGEIIGLITTNNFIFYFNEHGPDIGALPVKVIKYDYCEVNKMIINRAAPIEDARTLRIGEALYNNYLYQLFTIEFVNYLNNERNETMRAALKQLIKETNFKEDVSGFRKKVRNLLAELYPADYDLLRKQLITFYYKHFDKRALFSEIDRTIYDFDYITLNKLKKLGRDALKEEIKNIAEFFAVQRQFDSKNIKFPNIYMPCSDMLDETSYCDKSKLIINRPIDEFADILASDLTDSLKSKYILNNIWMDALVDWLSFAKFPTEIITVYKLTE
jgi:hypothetical protein